MARLALCWQQRSRFFGTLALGAMSATAAGPTVATTGGSVEGLTGPSGDEWRASRTRLPPIGSLRWRPPAPVTPWPGVRRHELVRAVHPARLPPDGIATDGSRGLPVPERLAPQRAPCELGPARDGAPASGAGTSSARRTRMRARSRTAA